MKMSSLVFLMICGLSALLAGCGPSYFEWLKYTENNVRIFVSFVPCTVKQDTLPSVESQRYYSQTGEQKLPRDRERIVRYDHGIPIDEGRLPPQASLVSFVDESGASRTERAYVVSDSIRAPEMKALYYVGGNAPTPPTTETCVVQTSVPWMVDRNRPFWVADNTLSLDGKSFKTSNDGAGLILVGLPALLMVGMLFTAAGYSGGSSSERQDGLKLSGAVMVIGCALLFVARTYWIEPPAVLLEKTQNFYRSYNQMPQASGHLLPFSGSAAKTFFAGPPAPTDFSQPMDVYQGIAIGTLVLWLFVSFKRLYMGCHYLLVSHPASPIVLPALRSGKSVDTKSLGQTLREGAADPGSRSTVYYENQAAKAHVLKEKLDADAEIAEAIIRRERARAALVDAEREVREAKRRAEKKR